MRTMTSASRRHALYAPHRIDVLCGVRGGQGARDDADVTCLRCLASLGVRPLRGVQKQATKLRLQAARESLERKVTDVVEKA